MCSSAGLARLADRVSLAFETWCGSAMTCACARVIGKRSDVHRNRAAVGRIASVAPQGDGLRLVVRPELDVADVAVGDSIAVNGCCLTVVAIEADGLAFDVSAETLRCTAGLDGTTDVNLEKALRLADRLGGHLMTGHVDGVGTVAEFAPVADEAPGAVRADTGTDPAERSWRLEVEAPAALARFIAAKGSIAVQGVSLTVNHVEGARFDVNLIPHTLAVTTLGALTPGALVNLEVDLVARYVERLSSSVSGDIARVRTKPNGVRNTRMQRSSVMQWVVAGSLAITTLSCGPSDSQDDAAAAAQAFSCGDLAMAPEVLIRGLPNNITRRPSTRWAPCMPTAEAFATIMPRRWRGIARRPTRVTRRPSTAWDWGTAMATGSAGHCRGDGLVSQGRRAGSCSRPYRRHV